jgi:hypothetical protein
VSEIIKIINKYPEGEELFQNSAVFRRLVYAMAKGMSPEAALVEAIKVSDQMAAHTKEILEKGLTPTIKLEFNQLPEYIQTNYLATLPKPSRLKRFWNGWCQMAGWIAIAGLLITLYLKLTHRL